MWIFLFPLSSFLSPLLCNPAKTSLLAEAQCQERELQCPPPSAATGTGPSTTGTLGVSRAAGAGRGSSCPQLQIMPLHATTPQHPKQGNPTPPVPSVLCCVPTVALEPSGAGIGPGGGAGPGLGVWGTHWCCGVKAESHGDTSGDGVCTLVATGEMPNVHCLRLCCRCPKLSLCLEDNCARRSPRGRYLPWPRKAWCKACRMLNVLSPLGGTAVGWHLKLPSP